MARTHYDTVSKRDLTPRQREVLALIAAGKTNREIGDALGMTLDGAKFHVSEIMAKLGVSMREEAAEWWRAQRGVRPLTSRGLRGVVGFSALKWAAAPAALAIGVVALVPFLTGNKEPEPALHYSGWVAAGGSGDDLWLQGAGWPQGIETAVEAQHIVIGTVEIFGEEHSGHGIFRTYRLATVRIDEVVATSGGRLPDRIQVLVPVGVFDAGPTFTVGDSALLYLDAAEFEWLEPGVWTSWLDQTIHSTPEIRTAPNSLPLEMVIKAIRERRD